MTKCVVALVVFCHAYGETSVRRKYKVTKPEKVEMGRSG